MSSSSNMTPLLQDSPPAPTATPSSTALANSSPPVSNSSSTPLHTAGSGSLAAHLGQLQLAAADTPTGRHLDDDGLLAVLLRHPSISQDQQVVAALQATSKPLQAAAARLLRPGTLAGTLHVTRRAQVQSLGLWLRKHGSLLRELAVHVADSKASSPSITFDRTWKRPVPSSKHPFKRLQDTATTELARALQQTAASGMLQLQSFSLTGAAATCSSLGVRKGCACLWHSLPAAALTRLCAQVRNTAGFHNDLSAVAELSGLRSLQLSSSVPGYSPTAFQSLTGLKQLTQLFVSPISPQQLPYLPCQLQQLHLTVAISKMTALDKSVVDDVEQFADWLQCNSSTVRSLELAGPTFF
jgi:hypothetical protein